MAKSQTSLKKFSFLRFFSWLLLLSVALIILIPVAAYFFFDPNDFRPQIAAYITNKTGLPLQIEGKIDFKIFPEPQLNVKNITLPQPDDQGHFIKIEEMGFEMPLREFLQANFKIQSLTLKGADIHLIKYANGSTNWEKISQKFSDTRAEQAQKAEASHKEKETKAPANKKRLAFAIEHIELQQAKMTYQDKAQNQLIILNKVHMQHDNRQPEDYPIQGELDFAVPMEKAKMVKGHGDFKGKALWKPQASPRVQLQTAITVHLPEVIAGMKDVKITMEPQGNLNKAIALKNLRLQSGDIQASGQVNIPMDTTQPISFNLVMNQLNLDKLAARTTTAQTSTLTSATSPIQYTTAKTSSAKASRAMNGEVRVNQLITQQLTLRNVHATVRKNGNNVKLAPLTADFYQGKLNAQVTKNLADPNGAAFQGKLSNVHLQSLLQALKKTDRLSGNAFVDFNLTQTSRGLNGTSHVRIQQGMLQGIDVKYYLALAQSLLKKETTTQPNTKMTPFNSLTSTLKINNNIIYNNDLQILSDDFKANGDGSVDLNAQTLEYKLLAVRQYQDNKEHPNAYPLAIRIKGPWQHPNIQPDMDVYLKKALEHEMKKQVNKQIDKHLGKNLGKILGGSGSESDGESAQQGESPVSPEDKIKDKVQEGIEKGVKKLFKLP